MRRSEVHATESVACLNRALIRLKDIWEEIGIPEDQRMQRTDVVYKHIKGLLDMMISEEEGLRERMTDSIDACRKELDKLCTELQLPPLEEEAGTTMLQLEINLRTNLADMLKHKTQRMQELKDLVNQDHEMCDIMCAAPFCIDTDAVPSLEQLGNYRTYLNNQTKEKERRHCVFVDIKKQIILCMDDLDQLPDTSFEKDVVCEDEDAFCLSNDNIDALTVLLAQLEERKAENDLLCSAYRTEIQELWERLQIPQEEREPMYQHMDQSKKKNMETLRAEAQRLEVLKMKNMKNVVEAIRAELALLWEKSFYSAEQRQAFLPYYSDEFTEELLKQHEAEVSDLKRRYEEHRELFEAVTRWKDNWTLFLELDKKANDPSRFNNRGGNLLKEEKQRSDLQKSLPKLEKTLKVQMDQWEEEHGRGFLVNGQKFLDYVSQQWDSLQMEKDKEKLERQMKKTKQTEEDMLYGTSFRTPSKRRIGMTPTSGKVRKVNASTCISTPNTTFRSGLGGTICNSPVLRQPLSSSKGHGLRTPKTPRALDRNKENISHMGRTPLRGQQRPPHSSRTCSINSVASTYSEFEKDFGNHESTALSSVISPRPHNLS